ncbi:Ubiquitinyl hydrolase 1 [Bertholletia excelsa]
MDNSSKELLELEQENLSSSTIESKLLVCKNNDLQQRQNLKSKPSDGMPNISSVPKSQVLGQVKDFLGVISEANKRLQDDVKDNATDYDIEVLNGNESEYIEMDLMLGVADLLTPEAIAAAESAMTGSHPVISLEASSSSSGTESESEVSSNDGSDNEINDDDNQGNDNSTCHPTKSKRCESIEEASFSESSRKHKSKKRQKIVELL